MGKHQKLFEQACALLGVDSTKIRCVGPAEFKRITGIGAGRNLGRANSYKYKENGERVVYVRRRCTLDVFVHELLHHLFPSRPHWWIFVASWELTDTPALRGHWYGYGKSLHAEPRQIEDRGTLIKLARNASKRIGVGQG